MAEKLIIAGEEVVDVTGEEIHDYPLLNGVEDLNEAPVIVYNKELVVPQGGVFSDKELRVAHEIGHIVCDPLPDGDGGARINGSSMDVTLGYYFYTAGDGEESLGGMFNPFSQEDTERYFYANDGHETDYYEAKPWAEVKKKLGKNAIEQFGDLTHIEGIPEEHPIILLRPNERILAHTHEFIGIKPPGTTSMQARSTTGRIGLSACYCAGWGDPGYINRWTMEIHNLNENEYLPIPVGWRIAQVVFSSTGPVGTEYAKATGSYQKSSANDLTEIKRLWTPEQLIPKAYKNEIILPAPVNGLSEGIK